MNKLRFIKQEHYLELINLYHLARTALCGPDKIVTKYDRMIWAANEFSKKYSYTSATGAYKDLSDNLIDY